MREAFENKRASSDELLGLSAQLGKMIGMIHNNGIIHGDLTTSNVIQRAYDKRLVLIDFGLSKLSCSVEDKAVDMYVLERAFSSTHPTSGFLFEKVLESYEEVLETKDSSRIMARFKAVQQRGRKRDMIG